ncbi:MAG: hypothetical protein JWM76_2447 [Pseudonocardiales bacterium]|nr:hypothetical protein [Pseudonocardiales bacterium]
MTTTVPSGAPTLNSSPLGLAQLYAAIGARLLAAAAAPVTDALGAISRLAVHVVPGVESASVTWGRPHQFKTVGPTDELALAGDKIQYELDGGPCVDAILQNSIFRVGDLASDTRWPEFARRAHAELGVRSMLSYRFYFEDGGRIAGLNLYSTQPDAFDDDSETIGMLLATHGALAVTAARSNEMATNLTKALDSNREIGVAIGILMSKHKLTRVEAFDLLRIASQNTNRKLVTLATEVADSDDLDLSNHYLRAKSESAA